LGRYSKSGIHFKGTGRPYGTNKMNPNWALRYTFGYIIRRGYSQVEKVN
jgi:hypothetical protein